LLTLFSTSLFAQKEANYWYFGEKAGLDFSSGSPLAVSNGQLSTVEGCATVSDKNGNLLFYTNGENVWNNKHQIMPNGTGLMGGYSSTQSAIVVPFPGNDSLYYIFTTAQEKNPYGLRYSIVNMKKDNGSGDVITKNVLLLDNVYEKVSAVKKVNCPEYWVVTKKWDSDEYYSYLITSSGISSPVISSTGNFTGGPSEYSRGQIKFSPDGTKLAVAYNIAYDFFELMDFDQATGALSNPIKLTPNPPPTETFSVGAYGVEFSPNSQLLYVAASYLFSTPKLFTIYQYNVSYSDPSQVVASKKLINGTEFNYGMQLGPDKKIYIATYDDYLNAIDNPDVEGTGCGFEKKAVSLTASSKGSLPTFIQSYFTDPIIALGNCEFQNINFSIQHNNDLSNVEWNFGDEASGADNSSTSFAQLHIYSTEGVYTVRLIFLRNGGCSADTVYKKIYAGPFKLYLGKDTTICKGDTLLLSVSIPNAKYLWSNGSADNSFKISDAGKYWVTANLNSCLATDSINIDVRSLPAFAIGKDTSICLNDKITLSPSPGFTNATYQWNTGAASSNIEVSQPSIYWLTVTDDIGCHYTDSITVSQIQLPQFSLGNDTTLCQTNLQLNAAVSGATAYVWNTGESSPSINVNQTGTYWADVTKDNCAYRDSVKIVFNPYPVLNLGRDTTLCEEKTLLLDAQNAGATYLWHDNSNNQTYLVEKPGKYYVTVTDNNCSSRDTILINYNLKPVFSLGSDFSICSGQAIILKPTIQNEKSVNYLWQDGSSNPTYNVVAPGVYNLTLSNDCGSKTDSIVAMRGACKLYVPNAFTPNGDGLNDVFKASYGENITKFKMEIYNRWGQKVFESNDMTKGWDGTYQQNMLKGVFVWIIKYDSVDLKNQIMKGTVVLIR
jgi:gliding motility-associated-like protein